LVKSCSSCAEERGPNNMFTKILIADRGENAIRIIRACKELDVQTVAVFSEADREGLHVSLADESYCIGGALLKDSYLNMDAILTTAIATGVEAIHPGCGFLSENAGFAKLCHESGLVFIGPDTETIALMGDKETADKIMQEAGVPVFHDNETVMDTAQLKHIGMQLLADNFGNIVCLGERDNSIRRNNKIQIGESPAVTVPEDVRERMIEASIKAGKAIKYRGAGTIGYICDNNGNFFFAGMDTRLQTGYSVTEMVTWIDLVKWQIRIASGLELDFRQKDIEFRGHAIECRIYADDTWRGDMSRGKVEFLNVPGGPWVRFDTALYQGYDMPPFSDSLLGELIVYARTRDEAIVKMKAALSELAIEGVAHNAVYQAELLSAGATVRCPANEGEYLSPNTVEIV